MEKENLVIDDGIHKPTGYQRADIQQRIKKTLAERAASGISPCFSDNPKKIDAEREAFYMSKVHYD